MKIPDLLLLNHPTLKAACGVDCGPWDLVSILLPNLIVLAGVIFFLLIVYYGWRLIAVAGSDIGPQQVQKAQQAVSYSTIGFLLVISAYFILQVVGVATQIKFF